MLKISIQVPNNMSTIARTNLSTAVASVLTGHLNLPRQQFRYIELCSIHPRTSSNKNSKNFRRELGASATTTTELYAYTIPDDVNQQSVDAVDMSDFSSSTTEETYVLSQDSNVIYTAPTVLSVNVDETGGQDVHGGSSTGSNSEPAGESGESDSGSDTTIWIYVVIAVGFFAIGGFFVAVVIGLKRKRSNRKNGTSTFKIEKMKCSNCVTIIIVIIVKIVFICSFLF